jgi:hypothetical protein
MFKLTIETGDAAFSSDPVGELEEIIDDITTRMHNGSIQGSIIDSNGNTIGQWSYDPPELED